MPKASKGRRRADQTTPSSNGTVKPRQNTRVREMSPRARLIALSVGDIICFLIFASLGTNAHGKGVNIPQTIWVALPFIAAWFAVAPLIGVYKADIATLPGKMLQRTLLAWLVSWPLAMLLRWVQVERLSPVTPAQFLSFSLVALIANTLILTIWRWPFALNNSLRKRGV